MTPIVLPQFEGDEIEEIGDASVDSDSSERSSTDEDSDEDLSAFSDLDLTEFPEIKEDELGLPAMLEPDVALMSYEEAVSKIPEEFREELVKKLRAEFREVRPYQPRFPKK